MDRNAAEWPHFIESWHAIVPTWMLRTASARISIGEAVDRVASRGDGFLHDLE